MDRQLLIVGLLALITAIAVGQPSPAPGVAAVTAQRRGCGGCGCNGQGC